jgi:1,4-dihydroxy-2-naphthoate octaprenyltransferase
MINKILYTTIFMMSFLIGVAYMLDDFISIGIIIILTIVLILYTIGNRYIKNLLHSCKWL